MARPQCDGLKYFPIDVNFFSNKNVRILKSQYHSDGVAAYLWLLCEIYRDKGYYIERDKDLVYIMADDLNITSDKIELIIGYLLSRTMLIEVTHPSTSVKTLTARSIQIQYQESTKGLRRDVEVSEDLWLLEPEKTASHIKVVKNKINTVKTNINTGLTKVNTGLTTQIKVNENKVNKKKTKENSCENVPVSFQTIIDAWNNTVNDLPKVVKVSDGRKRAIRSILKQFNEDSVMTVFKAVCESDFLCGRTDKPWSGCGFDWVMKPSNFVKILEGNYKNRPKQMAWNAGNNKMVSDPFDAERDAAYDAFDSAWLREAAAMEPKGD